MIEYKLIKKLLFEHSPQIDFISQPKDDKMHYWNHCWFNPEEYSEFWEKVVKSPYEVLQVQDFNGYVHNLTYPIFTGSLKKYANIISVKRARDGEVFSVGDIVSATDNPYFDGENYIEKSSGKWKKEYYSTKIKSFKLIEQGVVCIFDEGVEKYGQLLDHVEKKERKLLFKAEDGVDIFEGDEWFSLHTDYNDGLNFHEPMEIIRDKKAFLNLSNEHIKRFSTQEAAEKYILMNKKALSINDFLCIIGDNSPLFKDELIRRAVVRIKLNTKK